MRERTIRYRPSHLITKTNRDGPFELFSAATMSAPIYSPALPSEASAQAGLIFWFVPWRRDEQEISFIL